MNAHCATGHQSIVTSMQPLLGIIIWPMSIHKQSCTAACKQKCATQCMQISPDSNIRNAPHQPSPQPPATSHGTGTAKVPQILPTEYSQQPHAQAYSQPQPPHTAPAPKIPNIKPNSLPNKVRTPPRRRCLGKYHHHPKVEFGKKPGFGRVRGHKLAKCIVIRAEN